MEDYNMLAVIDKNMQWINYGYRCFEMGIAAYQLWQDQSFIIAIC